jgi:hypothetical protein
VSHGLLQHAHGKDVMQDREGPWGRGCTFVMCHGPFQHSHGTQVEVSSHSQMHHLHSKRRDHGQCIVAHGKEVEHFKHPMDHCNMCMGQVSWSRTGPWGMDSGQWDNRLNCQNVPWSNSTCPWDRCDTAGDRTMGDA